MPVVVASAGVLLQNRRPLVCASIRSRPTRLRFPVFFTLRKIGLETPGHEAQRIGSQVLFRGELCHVFSYIKRSAPPDAWIVSPVTKPFLSEARNAATAAISSGLPKRPTGVSSAPSRAITSSSVNSAKFGAFSADSRYHIVCPVVRCHCPNTNGVYENPILGDFERETLSNVIDCGTERMGDEELRVRINASDRRHIDYPTPL
jgi:hypothetical protein